MAEIEYKGVKVGGSKLLLIIPLIGTLIGGLWGGFEVYQRYLLMEKKINSFVSPDLSDYDKRIELVQQEVTMLKQEMTMILEEVQLVSDVAKELKDDLRLDLRNMQKDNRHIESIVNAVEDSTKENHRELLDDIKKLEEELDLKIILPYVVIIASIAMTWGMWSERLEAVEKKADSVTQMQQDIAIIKEKIMWMESYLMGDN